MARPLLVHDPRGAVLAALDHGGVEGGDQPLPVQGDEAVEVLLGLRQVLVQADVQVYRILRHAASLVRPGVPAALPPRSPAPRLQPFYHERPRRVTPSPGRRGA